MRSDHSTHRCISANRRDASGTDRPHRNIRSADDTDQPGITKQQFETAVSVWSWMQPGNEAPTVAATAASFNTTPEIVRQCVRASEWMFLDGPDDDPTKQRVETREADEQKSPPSAPSGR